MSGHTPGPWQFWKGRLHPDRHETRGVFRPGRAAQIRCDHEPDLHLIAAAPELLEACEAVVHDTDMKKNRWGLWSKCKKAVDRAKGADAPGETT